MLTIMSKFPDLSELGYQVKRELGQNRAGGRVTYLAKSTNTQLPVVIKQFQFTQSGFSWSDYDAYQREIQVLQQLNHPGIPRYLDSLETPAGFCLVQEYTPASSLAQPHHWTPEEVKQIAVAVLEVLVYLQSACPPVIHRDIKPENILVDRQGELKVTLVDFGFARMGGGEVAVSSVVKGTLGFMPPEQLFNRQLTEASDLYSLGATLICLLTQTKSAEIGNLIDETYRINFKQLVPKLSPQFIDWLQKMVSPSLKNRYPNAAAALEALQPIAVVGNTTKFRMPATKVRLTTLCFFALLVISSMMENPEDPVRQLRETNQCPGCDLNGANLGSFNLGSSNLRSANLERANLGRALLGRANLERANLERAYLGSAYLGNAFLESANLGNADLTGAYLTGADLTGADLTGADLTGAKLGSTDLRGADLRGAYLEDAKLGGADLRGANLRDAYLEGADLRGAKMPDGSIHK